MGEQAEEPGECDGQREAHHGDEEEAPQLEEVDPVAHREVGHQDECQRDQQHGSPAGGQCKRLVDEPHQQAAPGAEQQGAQPGLVEELGHIRA